MTSETTPAQRSWTDPETAKALVALAGAGAGQVYGVAWQLRSTTQAQVKYVVQAKAEHNWALTCTCGKERCYHTETVLNILGAISAVTRLVPPGTPWPSEVHDEPVAPAQPQQQKGARR